MSKKSRQTKQKEQIEMAISCFNGLFTAEDLLDSVRKGNKTIGIATVYRLLKSLDRQGKVHSYLCSRQKLYSRYNENHCHFICHRCGRTEHLELKKLDFIKLDTGLGQACHFQLDIHGVCKKCLENSKPNIDRL
jgi:Fe2+ or Zn2+ uptake regulation protein